MREVTARRLRSAGIVLGTWLVATVIAAVPGDTTRWHWTVIWAYAFGYVAVAYWPAYGVAHALTAAPPRKKALFAMVAASAFALTLTEMR